MKQPCPKCKDFINGFFQIDIYDKPYCNIGNEPFVNHMYRETCPDYSPRWYVRAIAWLKGWFVSVIVWSGCMGAAWWICKMFGDVIWMWTFGYWIELLKGR